MGSSTEPGRVLVVTNDFPPTLGGIQTYVRNYVETLDPARVHVFASTQDAGAAARFDADAAYAVHRWPRAVMLPTPGTARAMSAIIASERIDTVWFAAAAPLALMAPAARRAGARRVVASTHGHEIGWSMVPGGCAVLRRIGASVDCLTYVSRYAHRRLAGPFGPQVAWEPLPGGVDPQVFTPEAGLVERLRRRYGLEGKRVIVAVSRIVARKGQDQLVSALPSILRSVPDAHLLIVGPGSYGRVLRRRARRLGVEEHLTLTGAVPFEELPAHYALGDVFALPVRTQAGGLSVEGLGIVFLESQACGVATVAGRGGGAPETVVDGVTGVTVDGRDRDAVAHTVTSLLRDAEARQRLARAGQAHVRRAWTHDVLGRQLDAVLAGDGRVPPPHSFNYPVGERG